MDKLILDALRSGKKTPREINTHTGIAMFKIYFRLNQLKKNNFIGKTENKPRRNGRSHFHVYLIDEKKTFFTPLDEKDERRVRMHEIIISDTIKIKIIRNDQSDIKWYHLFDDKNKILIAKKRGKFITRTNAYLFEKYGAEMQRRFDRKIREHIGQKKTLNKRIAEKNIEEKNQTKPITLTKLDSSILDTLKVTGEITTKKLHDMLPIPRQNLYDRLMKLKRKGCVDRIKRMSIDRNERTQWYYFLIFDGKVETAP